MLLRADGNPTYMHAVVVDDHDMGMTHVIRGDDHLTNAARQIPIFHAMGWNAPRYAHVPLIHGPDGAKLSKRHGALAVQAYREMGYLPEALCNYLMRLGWSHGDREIMTQGGSNSAVFDLANVGRGPARLDFAKLDSVNAHYMKTAPTMSGWRRLVFELYRHCSGIGRIGPGGTARIAAGVTVLKSRAKTMVELADQAFFLVRRRPVALDVAAQKAMKDGVAERLSRLLPDRLEAAPAWDEAALSRTLKDFAADRRCRHGPDRARASRGVDGRRAGARSRSDAGAARPRRNAWAGSRTEFDAGASLKKPWARTAHGKERVMENKVQPKGSATLILDNKKLELPVYGGSVGPDVIDIRKLYAESGAFTYDPGFTSTASCESQITYIDGDEGVLLYRGYPIDQLAEQGRAFIEVCYLLLTASCRAPISSRPFDQGHHLPHDAACAVRPLLRRLPARRAPDGGDGGRGRRARGLLPRQPRHRRSRASARSPATA